MYEYECISNSESGRNPIKLGVTDENGIIGIYISRDYIECFIGELTGRISERYRTELVDETKETLCDKLKHSADELINTKKNILGIGVSVIGPLDSENGIILNPPNFYGIENLNIKAFLQEQYRLPVYVDNDMNTSALAEKYWGYAANISDYIYIGASNGIGAGIVNDFRLTSAVGEIGHISVDLNGPRCHCGNVGCLEMYASVKENCSEKEAQEKCMYLSQGIITLMNIMNPKKIFLGHRIPLLGENVPEKIKEYISDKYIYRSLNDVEIQYSMFGQDSPVYGAIAVFIENNMF